MAQAAPFYFTGTLSDYSAPDHDVIAVVQMRGHALRDYSGFYGERVLTLPADFDTFKLIRTMEYTDNTVTVYSRTGGA